MEDIIICEATMDDKNEMNVIRKQVNDLHVAGESKIFKPGFNENMASFCETFIKNEQGKKALVAKENGKVVGYALLEFVFKEETDYRFTQRFLEVGEFGVLEGNKKKGIGRKLVERIRLIAKENGYDEIRLDMWSFNEGALKFYEAVGFETYRRHMRTGV